MWIAHGLKRRGAYISHTECTTGRSSAGRSPVAGSIWAAVTVDESNLRVHAKRVNITLPQRVLDAVDRFAKAQGQTRSGLLARAAVRYMADQAGAARYRPAPRASGKPGKARK